MKYKALYRHVLHPFEDKYVGTIACVYKDDIIWVGFSQCHPKDQFCKRTGRDLAYENALCGSFKKEIPTKTPFGKEKPIGAEIRPMLSKAQRYFKKPVQLTYED